MTRVTENLSQFYAQAILASEVPFDMLFGRYKASRCCRHCYCTGRAGRNVPYCYNRKEAKAHGEAAHVAQRCRPGTDHR